MRQLAQLFKTEHLKEHFEQLDALLAQKERDNDYLVQQEKIRTLAHKKRQHQEVYGKKFADGEVASTWLGASTLRRGGPKKDLSPQGAA